jgi:hypothetical protein
MKLVLYVRDGCHLCDQFLLDFSLDFPEAAAVLQLRDVDADAALAVEYGLRVPVLSAAGKAICEGAYDCGEVRRALGL